LLKGAVEKGKPMEPAISAPMLKDCQVRRGRKLQTQETHQLWIKPIAEKETLSSSPSTEKEKKKKDKQGPSHQRKREREDAFH